MIKTFHQSLMGMLSLCLTFFVLISACEKTEDLVLINDPDDDGFVTHPYVDAFNPETKEWTKLPDLPKPTSACGAGIVGNRLLAVTGEQLNGDGFTGHFLIPDSFAFDFQTWEWTKVSKCPTPKHGTQAVVIDGVFYFPGGGIMAYSYSSTNANNSFEF